MKHSGNERENEPKIANLPKCKWMQANAQGGAGSKSDLGNKLMPWCRYQGGWLAGRQMPGRLGGLLVGRYQGG